MAYAHLIPSWLNYQKFAVCVFLVFEVIYKTKHLKVQHVYDCAAGYSNWLPVKV